jgi:UDP-N-acetylglucosamine--N-acetylmuramyl-(pentapeptide) pyrophosphoryl-undecaprenol N-acetylglucosamine transferase
MKAGDERPVLLVAGGSGGHVYPALAAAEELLRRGAPAHLATDQRGLTYVSKSLLQIPLHILNGSHKRAAKWSRFISKVTYGMGALLRSAVLLQRLKPSVVVGFGGFATLPTLIAALMMRYPFVLHEQNAVLGKVNRLFARGARRIAVSYECTQLLPKAYANKMIETGMPTRPALVAVAVEHPYRLPESDRKLTLFIFGGSQGAKSFEDTLPEMMALAPEDIRARIHLIQQCRNEMCEALRVRYERMGVTAELSPFFEDMAARYARAHVVICRAGASSIAELKATGRPAILIPYPWAADDHQSVNAGEIEAAAGGWVLQQKHFTAQRLLNIVLSLLEHPQTLLYAAQSMQRLATKQARILLADAIEAVSREGNIYSLRRETQS